MGDRKAKSTLVTLEQSLEPAVRPPKPLEGLVKGLYPAYHLVVLISLTCFSV